VSKIIIAEYFKQEKESEIMVSFIIILQAQY